MKQGYIHVLNNFKDAQKLLSPACAINTQTFFLVQLFPTCKFKLLSIRYHIPCSFLLDSGFPSIIPRANINGILIMRYRDVVYM